MGHRDRDRERSPSRRHRDHDRSRSREHESRKRDRTRSPDRKEKRLVVSPVPGIQPPQAQLAISRRKRDKSEERRSKKSEKKRLKEEQDARNIAELSVYAGADNPFHDSNLSQQFRWHKKAEKDRKSGLDPLESQRRDAVRRQEAKEELERLNKRRADREVESRIREEDDLRMQRLQESAEMSQWLAKEDDFRLDQERSRAAIRIKEKRAKAIDFLCLNLKYVNPPSPDEEQEIDDSALEIDLDEPYAIFDVRGLYHSLSVVAVLTFL